MLIRAESPQTNQPTQKPPIHQNLIRLCEIVYTKKRLFTLASARLASLYNTHGQDIRLASRLVMSTAASERASSIDAGIRD